MRGGLRLILPFVLVGCFFWAAYLAIGLQFAAHNTLHNDVFFHSDTRRVMLDMCVVDAKHRRTNVHPLFVLFANPIGAPLSSLVGSLETAAVLLNSLSGALCIALAGWFLSDAGVSLGRALIFSLILGCSAAHLFFGSAPETYSLSALSIILLFCVAKRHPGDLLYFVPAGIFTFGVLITNLAMATLAVGSSLRQINAKWKALLRTTAFVALVIVIAGGLAVFEKRVWSQSTLFFVPDTYAGESNFIHTPFEWRGFKRRESLLLRYVLAFDWFAPPVLVRSDDKRALIVNFDNRSLMHLSVFGMAALGLWSVLLLTSLVVFIRARLYRMPIHLGLFLCLLFNLGLHSLYGDDMFLYSCNTCFLLVAWVALCTSELRTARFQCRAMDAGLLVLLGLEIANNARFVASLLALRQS